MNANKRLLMGMLKEDISLTVPVYQREYKWTEVECMGLLKDLFEERETYFLGTIVTSVVKTGVRKELVDGQQRVTTTYLILFALKKILDEKKLDSRNLNTLLFLEDQSFSLDLKEDDLKMKLSPQEKDRDALNSIRTGETENYSTSLIVKNYRYIYKFLMSSLEDEKENLSLAVQKIVQRLKSIEIVEISLEDYDDPQQIFESLNSNGMLLSESELIKNFLLMQLDPDYQEYFHEHDYLPLENLIDNSKLDELYRLFLMLKSPKMILLNKQEIFVTFKEYYQSTYVSVDENGQLESLEDFLSEFKRYANIYAHLINEDGPYIEINRSLKVFSKLGKRVFHPFFLSLYLDFEEGTLSEVDFLSILHLTESYLVRRLTCNLSNQALEQLFVRCARTIKSNHLREYKSFLSERNDTTMRFPLNDEFEKHFKIHHMHSTYVGKHIMTSVEQILNKEVIDSDNLVLRRIIPIEPVRSWKKILGEDYLEEYEYRLNSLGNLVLVPSSFSERFEKMSIQDKKIKILESSVANLSVNKKMIDSEKWSLHEIEENILMFYDKAISLWPEIPNC